MCSTVSPSRNLLVCLPECMFESVGVCTCFGESYRGRDGDQRCESVCLLSHQLLWSQWHQASRQKAIRRKVLQRWDTGLVQSNGKMVLKPGFTAISLIEIEFRTPERVLIFLSSSRKPLWKQSKMESQENTSLLQGSIMSNLLPSNLLGLHSVMPCSQLELSYPLGLGWCLHSFVCVCVRVHRMMSTESANSFTLIGEASDGGTMENLSRRLKVTSDLFDIMSGQTDVDHPLCEECTDTLLDHLDTQLNITENECQNYKWVVIHCNYTNITELVGSQSVLHYVTHSRICPRNIFLGRETHSDLVYTNILLPGAILCVKRGSLICMHESFVWIWACFWCLCMCRAILLFTFDWRARIPVWWHWWFLRTGGLIGGR